MVPPILAVKGKQRALSSHTHCVGAWLEHGERCESPCGDIPVQTRNTCLLLCHFLVQSSLNEANKEQGLVRSYQCLLILLLMEFSDLRKLLSQLLPSRYHVEGAQGSFSNSPLLSWRVISCSTSHHITAKWNVSLLMVCHVPLLLGGIGQAHC